MGSGVVGKDPPQIKVDGARTQPPTELSRLAYIVAFLIAGFTVVVGLLGPIILLSLALIPLCAGIAGGACSKSSGFDCAR
jgi:hypothetical protein